MPLDNPTVLMTADAIGGLWTYALDLGRELARKKMRIVLAVFGAGLDDAKREAARVAGLSLVDTGLPPDWLAGDPAEVARAGQALAAIVRSERVDLIHLSHPALAAETRFEVPVLAGCHSCVATWWEAVKGTPLPEAVRWRADLVSRGYRAAQVLVAPSRAFAEATQRVYALDRMPEVVHSGRAPEPALPGSEAEPIEAVFTTGQFWDEAKNVGTLDRIAALTTAPFRAAGPTEGPDGTTVDLPHMEALGSLSEAEIRERLAQRPVYVSAALFEPFGLAVLEAAQAGCALVLSDLDSSRELWSDAALFVAASDEEGFAAAVGRLLSDPEMRADYAHAAQNRSRAFGLDAFSEDMANLYRGMLRTVAQAGAA